MCVVRDRSAAKVAHSTTHHATRANGIRRRALLARRLAGPRQKETLACSGYLFASCADCTRLARRSANASHGCRRALAPRAAVSLPTPKSTPKKLYRRRRLPEEESTSSEDASSSGNSKNEKEKSGRGRRSERRLRMLPLPKKARRKRPMTRTHPQRSTTGRTIRAHRRRPAVRCSTR